MKGWRGIRNTIDTVFGREDLRAVTAQPRPGPRSLSILLFLVSLSTSQLRGQVAVEPRIDTLSPSANASVSPAPAPPVFLAVACENSAVDLVLADPENRRLGNNPLHHQAYDEIPGASIDSAGQEDDGAGVEEEDRAEVMKILNPEPGRYTLTLVGARDGTYSCVIAASRGEGATAAISLRNQPLRRDEVEHVQFTFQPKSNSFLVPIDSAATRP